ncbi:hypothetical protein L7F22_021751 [Adiantum nelumboides]|nr:hypothetical protein [Adiantum nelumboides]
MGAAHSKKVGSSLYDDGSWTPSNSSSSQGRVVKMYDPTEKTPRDISGPLELVDLYGDDAASEYIGYHDTPTPAPVSEKSKNTLKTKVFGVVGRAGTAGLGKAVGALDTIGSSMTNLNKGSGFTSAAAIKANTIGILAFEVANTIAKGYSLKESLSKDSIKFLKEEVLCSYGVQRLVSTDMTELLSIAATDKKTGCCCDHVPSRDAESKVYGSSATSYFVTASGTRKQRPEPVKAQPQVIHTAESMETPVHLSETMQSPKPMPNALEQVAETPVFQAVPVQPATFQQPIAGFNGQGSNLQAMKQVFPPPSVHPRYFGGGSVFQSMAGHAWKSVLHARNSVRGCSNDVA